MTAPKDTADARSAGHFSSDALQCHRPPVVLPLRLFPPASYYALGAASEKPMVAVATRFNKRDKAVHRYAIADVRGRLKLTVPVCKPSGCTSPEGVAWENVGVSDHGRWHEVHRIALESAYGRTPFFEHYIGRLAPVFTPPPSAQRPSVADICLSANRAVCAILGIRAPEPCRSRADWSLDAFDQAPSPPYWQVRQDQLGFIPSLSILDLIFNLGPEAPLYLLELQKLMHLR